MIAGDNLDRIPQVHMEATSPLPPLQPPPHIRSVLECLPRHPDNAADPPSGSDTSGWISQPGYAQAASLGPRLGCSAEFLQVLQGLMRLLRPDLSGMQIATSAVGGTVTAPRDYLVSTESSSGPANNDAGGGESRNSPILQLWNQTS